MRLGFYDSGLGGLSVLKEFIARYGSKYSYVYFGDSARAPYGTKSAEQLKSYVLEIADFMQEKQVDVLVSACNSSSMYLDEMNFEDYFFQIISLNDVLAKYFEANQFDKPVALIATQATIASGRYKNWSVDIHPVACTDLVPLIETGKLDEAKLNWQAHLKNLPETITDVIIGCTHYSFLAKGADYHFIDPAKLVVEQFASSIFDDGLLNYQTKDKELDIDVHFSKADEKYLELVSSLLEGK
ncbi:MAG: aspartate/glutamate racemase family protein [Cyanobacteria bacterium]|nr:aspartate/glutamate racemase family protein [Cyanobacteriota bacterium]